MPLLGALDPGHFDRWSKVRPPTLIAAHSDTSLRRAPVSAPEGALPRSGENQREGRGAAGARPQRTASMTRVTASSKMSTWASW